MSPEAWVGIAALAVTGFSAIIGWASYIAWTASQMNTNITGLRADINAHKKGTDEEHQRIWKSIGELSHVSQLHETRLVRMESKGNQGGS